MEKGTLAFFVGVPFFVATAEPTGSLYALSNVDSLFPPSKRAAGKASTGFGDVRKSACCIAETPSRPCKATGLNST